MKYHFVNHNLTYVLYFILFSSTFILLCNGLLIFLVCMHCNALDAFMFRYFTIYCVMVENRLEKKML